MILVLALILIAAIGAPVFALFGAASLALYPEDSPSGSFIGLTLDVYGGMLADSPSLITIPLLAFAGSLLAATSAPERLSELAGWWLGGLPRPAHALLWLLFALVTTGAGGITTAALSALLLPTLMRLRREQGSARGAYRPFGARAAWRALTAVKWELPVPVAIGAGVTLGLHVAQATALAALYLVWIAVAVRRELSLARDLPRIALDSAVVVGTILGVAVTAIGFASFFQMQHETAGWLSELRLQLQFDYPQLVTALLFNAVLIAASWLLEPVPGVLLAAPLLWPLTDRYGLDLYQYSVIFLLNVELARFTWRPRARPDPEREPLPA